MDQSNIKKSLWNLIDERRDEITKLCSDLIRIPSENPPGNVKDIISFISRFLANKGIENQIREADNKHPNIIASIGDGPGLIFNGHCDVVPVGDIARWNFNPFSGEITASRIRGRGASDMKCGLGAALFAIGVFSQEKIPLNGSLQLHIVSDEETGGEYGTKWLVESGFAKNTFACIVAEPTGRDSCEVGQKGQARVHLIAEGTAAHGSIGNYVGENAIMKVVSILNRIEELRNMKGNYSQSQIQVLLDSKKITQEKLKKPNVSDVIDHVTVNPGIIKGGIKINIVPDLCEADIDIRIPIGLPSGDVIERFKDMLQQLDLGRIRYSFVCSEANFTEVSEPLVQTIVKNAEAVWHSKVIPSYQWASSDARYYRLKGIPTVQYGPANTEGIHSYNEDVDIEDVLNAAKVYSAAICDLLVTK